MAQGMQRQWPASPLPTPESLVLWAQQITRLLQEGAIIAGLGPGDVVGPASAADGNFPLFNGTTGKLLKDSGFPLGASGNRWGVVVSIGQSDGGMEVGQYIDFHNSDGDTSDFAVRLFTIGATTDLLMSPSTGPDAGATKRLVTLINSTLAQGDVIYFDGTNFVRLAPGTSGQFLKTNGAAAPAWATNPAPVVAAAQATTSGTAFDFTGLPAEVSRIIINFNGVSLSGTNQILVQIGDSGGIETTGYASASHDFTTGNSSTAGFIIRTALAADGVSGAMVLTKLDTNTWTSLHGITRAATTNASSSGGGSKTLSAGPLDRVRILASGADTFDAGSVNIVYD